MLLLLWSLCVVLYGNINMNNILLNPIPHYFGAISSAGCHTILRTTICTKHRIKEYMPLCTKKACQGPNRRKSPQMHLVSTCLNRPIHFCSIYFPVLRLSLSPFFKNQPIIINMLGIDFFWLTSLNLSYKYAVSISVRIQTSTFWT